MLITCASCVLAKIAAREAQARFPKVLLEDGPGDAFRHAYWAALMARSFGPEKSKEFTDAHESGARNSPEQRKMDLHNDAAGRALGPSTEARRASAEPSLRAHIGTSQTTSWMPQGAGN